MVQELPPKVLVRGGREDPLASARTGTSTQLAVRNARPIMGSAGGQSNRTTWYFQYRSANAAVRPPGDPLPLVRARFYGQAGASRNLPQEAVGIGKVPGVATPECFGRGLDDASPGRRGLP